MAKKIILVMVPPESQWLFATGERRQVHLRALQGPKVVLQAGAGGGSRKRRARNEDSEMKKRDEDETGEEFAESPLCNRHFTCVFFLYQLF